METPPQGAGQLARILEVVIYEPGAAPRTFKEGEILAAGMQGGTPLAAVKGDNDTIVEWYGVPLRLTKAAPSGLVAPSRGGLVQPI